MEYFAPTQASEASALLKKEGAYVLAGGTDLLVKLKSRMLKPNVVIDLKALPKIKAIERTTSGWWIGAATPCAEITEHEELTKEWPGVCEALGLIGSTQIQGRASLGGNLCNASPAADSVPAVIAANTICVIATENGEREDLVENIVLSPGVTSLKPGEFILGFKLPRSQGRSGDSYLRLIPRTEMDIAVVGVGVSLSLDKAGNLETIRVCLGAVAPRQVLLPDLQKTCIGKQPSEELVQTLVELARKACNPINDKRGTVDYRTTVAGVLTKRAFKIALERAQAK
ncbi:MAG: xanthine dehydrogenase family protein subunit M [Betaproteobacteria bacterium]